jgi:hypothetical protein
MIAGCRFRDVAVGRELKMFQVQPPAGLMHLQLCRQSWPMCDAACIVVLAHSLAGVRFNYATPSTLKPWDHVGM